jgi:hypothetical protein
MTKYAAGYAEQVPDFAVAHRGSVQTCGRGWSLRSGCCVVLNGGVIRLTGGVKCAKSHHKNRHSVALQLPALLQVSSTVKAVTHAACGKTAGAAGCSLTGVGHIDLTSCQPHVCTHCIAARL